MSENCNHDCASCSENCADRDPKSFLIEPNKKSKIKKIIGVVSGKGGVGKSLVTSLLASGMQKRGFHCGVLDADITGPSMTKVFGITEKAVGDEESVFPAYTSTGIQVISVNMMLESDETPVLWRGPIIAGMVKQFFQEVVFDDVDYLFVDMPPGTGDVPLTVFQSLPLDGVVIVTSPQELVSMVVSKAINMANMMSIKVLGLVENMSYVECSKCGEKNYVFGKSHIQEVADHFNLEVLAHLPIREKVAVACDEGKVETVEMPEIEHTLDVISKI